MTGDARWKMIRMPETSKGSAQKKQRRADENTEDAVKRAGLASLHGSEEHDWKVQFGAERGRLDHNFRKMTRCAIGYTCKASSRDKELRTTQLRTTKAASMVGALT